MLSPAPVRNLAALQANHRSDFPQQCSDLRARRFDGLGKSVERGRTLGAGRPFHDSRRLRHRRRANACRRALQRVGERDQRRSFDLAHAREQQASLPVE